MRKGALSGIPLSLCGLLAVCHSDQGGGLGIGGSGSGGTPLDASASGGISGSPDAALAAEAGGRTMDGSSVPLDGARSGDIGAGGNGGSGDGGSVSVCGARSCDADLEYCRVSFPGTGELRLYQW